MPKDWTRRTRVKVALVAALLGVLVWADARTQECTSDGVSAAGPYLPAEKVDHGVVCTAR